MHIACSALGAAACLLWWLCHPPPHTLPPLPLSRFHVGWAWVVGQAWPDPGHVILVFNFCTYMCVRNCENGQVTNEG